jgi:putative ABC transport system substrate-binding protein
MESRRRAFSILLVGAGLAALTPRPARAQQAKIPRISLISVGTDPDPQKPNPVWVAFLRGMAELGWKEGRNIVVERHFAGGQVARLPALAEEIARVRPDVVVATGEYETRTVSHALPSTPLVMMLVTDPVGAGLVESLARPGGAVTGLSTLGVETYAKRLQLLKEALPNLAKVGLLYNPTPAYGQALARYSESAAQAMGIALRALTVQTPEDVRKAFGVITEDKLEALLVVTDGVTYNQRGLIAASANQARVPAMYETRLFVDAGGLISYGPSYAGLARQAAGYVDRILHGAKPADLPIEQPTTFEMVLSSKAAAAIGFTFPPAILARADEVIE